MSEAEPRLNLDLFQLTNPYGSIDLARGIVVREVEGRGTFIDPVDSEANVRVSSDDSLVLEVDNKLAQAIPGFTALLPEASLPLHDTDPDFNLLEPFGAHKLGRKSPDAIGSAALVAMTETASLTLLSPDFFDKQGSRELLSVPLSSWSGAATYIAKLILVCEGQPMQVASGEGSQMVVYRIGYNAQTKELSAVDADDTDDDPGEDEDRGPDGGDPYPVRPIRPAGIAGAALKLPVDTKKEEPLRLVGSQIS